MYINETFPYITRSGATIRDKWVYGIYVSSGTNWLFHLITVPPLWMTAILNSRHPGRCVLPHNPWTQDFHHLDRSCFWCQCPGRTLSELEYAPQTLSCFRYGPQDTTMFAPQTPFICPPNTIHLPLDTLSWNSPLETILFPSGHLFAWCIPQT